MDVYSTAITGLKAFPDASSPYNALVNFYHAFNNRNLELMTSNWLPTEEASMSNPLGGIKRGWNEIEEVYKKIFYGRAKVYVEFYDYSIHATNSMFTSVGRERGTLEINGEKMDLLIRTSRTYTQYQGQWKQIHHHGSMDNPELLAMYQEIITGK